MSTTNSFSFRFLNGAHLKIIAMIAMLIDHAGAFILLPWLQSHPLTPEYRQWADLYTLSRSIGRIAFPIFCFLIVEGIHKTHNPWAYLKRLVIFAFISEIPYNLAKGLEPFNFAHQNVYFTLALGLFTLIILQQYRQPLLRMAVVIATVVLSIVLNTDYQMNGIMIIVMLYLLHSYRFWQSLAGALFFWQYSPWGMPAFALTYLYNGERGRLNSRIFYWFYPVHLLIYAGIRYYLAL